jgi:hypothetical protein
MLPGSTPRRRHSLSRIFCSISPEKSRCALSFPTCTRVTSPHFAPSISQYSKSKSSAKVPIFGKLDPWGSILKHLVWNEGSDKACVARLLLPSLSFFPPIDSKIYIFRAMTRDAKTVLGWAPERIIMCHGVS